MQSGFVESSSKEAALDILKGYGLYVTGIDLADKSSVLSKEIKFFEKVSAVDLVMFSRQLAVMFKSGVPLSEALEALASQIKKAKFREKITMIAQDVEGGTAFSKALSRFPGVFSNFYVSVVRAGEVSGTLNKSLTYLADHLEREYNLYSRIKGAMIYPALIITAVFGVFILITVFIIPQLVSVLEGSGAEPPFITLMAIALSYFMRKWWWIIILILIGGGVGIWQYRKTPTGKKFFDTIVLKIPWVNVFLKKLYLARFSENLSTLVSGGLPIGQALEVSGNVVGNWVYQRIIFEARDKVLKGQSISAVFASYPEIFTPLFYQMCMVGERTGHLVKTILTVADFYEEEINRVADNLVNILEPVLIVVLGGMVGLLMADVILPLYQISAGSF